MKHIYKRKLLNGKEENMSYEKFTVEILKVKEPLKIILTSIQNKSRKNTYLFLYIVYIIFCNIQMFSLLILIDSLTPL